MKNTIFVLVLCLFLHGCASTKTTVKLVPQALTGQKIIDQKGADAVISHKKTSAAVRPPAGAFLSEGRPMLYISVYGSQKPFDFSTEDIQVFVNGNPHRVLTYDALVKEIDRDQGSMAAALNSRLMAQSARTAEHAYKPSSNPEVFSPSDNPNIIGDTTKYGYKYDINSVAQNQSRANAQMQAQQMAMAKQKQQAISTLSEIMLKKTTVSPNTWHRKYVVIEKIPDSAQSNEIKVIIKVDDEKHEFLLNHFQL